MDIKKKGTNSKKHLVKCLKSIHPWGDQKVTKMETKFYAFVEEVAESRKKKALLVKMVLPIQAATDKE